MPDRKNAPPLLSRLAKLTSSSGLAAKPDIHVAGVVSPATGHASQGRPTLPPKLAFALLHSANALMAMLPGENITCIALQSSMYSVKSWYANAKDVRQAGLHQVSHCGLHSLLLCAFWLYTPNVTGMSCCRQCKAVAQPASPSSKQSSSSNIASVCRQWQQRPNAPSIQLRTHRLKISLQQWQHSRLCPVTAGQHPSDCTRPTMHRFISGCCQGCRSADISLVWARLEAEGFLALKAQIGQASSDVQGPSGVTECTP